MIFGPPPGTPGWLLQLDPSELGRAGPDRPGGATAGPAGAPEARGRPGARGGSIGGAQGRQGRPYRAAKKKTLF